MMQMPTVWIPMAHTECRLCRKSRIVILPSKSRFFIVLYECSCMPGFEGDGVTCEDINECSDSALNDCDNSNGKCENTSGGFTAR